MRAEQRLTPRAIEETRRAIEEADGNEVFLVGETGEDGRVCAVRVGARGNEEAVPVLGPQIRDGDAIIHNHPSGGVTPSGADLAVASRLGNQGIGFYIVDNDVEQVYVVAEPVEAREIVPLDRQALTRALLPGGALGRIFPQYERRDSQVAMLAAVCDSFNGDEICAAEAGTGVGKSLAYLLPAVQVLDDIGRLHEHRRRTGTLPRPSGAAPSLHAHCDLLRRLPARSAQAGLPSQFAVRSSS